MIRINEIRLSLDEEESLLKAKAAKLLKINEKYIQAIKNEIDKEIKRQKLTGCISHSWVKGHQTNTMKGTDAYWNNFVDKLAKGKDFDGKD